MIRVPLISGEIRPEEPTVTGNFTASIWFLAISWTVGMVGVILLVFMLKSKVIKRKRNLL